MHMVATSSRNMQRVLLISLVATLCYVAATFYFGLRAHSLALLSESGHNLSDTLTLIVLAAWIALAAIHRIVAPVAVQPRIMMAVAAAGVLMNGAIAALLWKSSSDVNIRTVFLHMLGDTLSTAAVIAGGAGILATGAMWLDPALSLLIAAMIAWSSASIVRETLNILLEGTPRALSLAEIRAAVNAVPGVLDVHDLHVWSLGSASHALASHVTIAEMPVSGSASILDAINSALRDRFHITHTTIQFEIVGCETTHGCSAPPDPESIGGAHHHRGHSH